MNEVLRIDRTSRNSPDGPFGHIDVRWVIGPEQGASLSAFGQSTYATGATHEPHYHELAEEIVIVVSGRGVQEVGDVPHEVGPGDICFIPRGVPHRITGTSDEDLVILWMFGGAPSIEESGYVVVDE